MIIQTNMRSVCKIFYCPLESVQRVSLLKELYSSLKAGFINPAFMVQGYFQIKYTKIRISDDLKVKEKQSTRCF